MALYRRVWPIDPAEVQIKPGLTALGRMLGKNAVFRAVINLDI